ncbi:hypothetical protein AX14_010780 [Amanita brunnescens Koide BX004]|nr:hypothetical protein AX14_010780 [Amanita brunnescens Koide BX004]
MLHLTSNSSAPGPDNVTWHHIKAVFDMEGVGEAICLMFNNVCDTGIWPRWFKESVSVIIPKPKKSDYTVPKSYRPIALLNTLGKLLTKVIANRLQFDAAANRLLHDGQCGGIQKHATIDAGLALLDFINTNRERGWHVSACTVDITQFFPSLNHHAATRVLSKLGFANCLVNLLSSYFEGRTTVYKWDSAMSAPYDFSMGTPQGDCLSPIISALYLSVAIKAIFPHLYPPAQSAASSSSTTGFSTQHRTLLLGTYASSLQHWFTCSLPLLALAFKSNHPRRNSCISTHLNWALRHELSLASTNLLSTSAGTTVIFLLHQPKSGAI